MIHNIYYCNGNILSYRYYTKYLQSCCSRRVQYWPLCTHSHNIALFDKKQHSLFVVWLNKKLFIKNNYLLARNYLKI